MRRREQKQEDEKGAPMVRIARWLDSRLGLSYEMLRPAPQYAINPFYWLGALAVAAFVIQGITGVIMMLYYVPSPSQAYSSTLYVFRNVDYGRFLETVHLYTAYAMIMLAFMHMMRGYFVSVHKKPRELMWIVGMLMGFVTLAFGFTGYLLPWTVVSKSATDVSVGLIQTLPPQLASFLSFLIVGGGGDAIQLLRFYDLHVVVLPAVLLVLLAAKMYMLEVHGISETVAGGELPERKRRLIPIFPDATLYVMGLGAVFGAGVLLISVLLPLGLPPEYSPQLAAQYTAQPEWYFLWIYQIVKISIFEGPGLPVALSLVTLIFIVLFLLPFIDRGDERRISARPNFVVIGIIFVAEVAVLAYWGLVTPGQVIPVEQAALVLGGTALVIALVSLGVFRTLYSKATNQLATKKLSSSAPTRSAVAWTGTSFVFVLLLGTLMIGNLLNSLVGLILNGVTANSAEYTAFSLVGLAGALVGTLYLIYRLDLATGTIKRRISSLEIGWESKKKQGENAARA